MTADFTLDPNDLVVGEFGTEYPSIRAASNPDPRLLSAVLAHGNSDLPFQANAIYAGSIFSKWNTPLLQAILSNLPANVRTLLDAGADPNGGLSIEDLQAIFVRFLRQRSWEDYGYEADEELDNFLSDPAITDPSTPLTLQELDHRRHGFSRFWTEHELVPLDKEKNADLLPVTIAAASTGSIEILRMLLDAGADVHSWTSVHTLDDSQSQSSLAVSTPLHAAIHNSKDEMVRYLLSRDFNPNAVPRHAACQAMAPLAASLSAESPSTSIFDALIAHPATQKNTVTPAYHVHPLHFAAAQHSVLLLAHVIVYMPLASASTTALGHNLLHVACLPLNDRHVQIFTPKCYSSIKEVRTLSRHWQPLQLQPQSILLPNQPRSWENYRTSTDSTGASAPPFTLPDSSFLYAQSDTVRYLVEQLGTDAPAQLAARDIHGNTPLHYLAGHRVRNEALVEWLLANVAGARSVWDAATNGAGFVPRELFDEGAHAVEEPHKEFWEWLTLGGFVPQSQAGRG